MKFLLQKFNFLVQNSIFRPDLVSEVLVVIFGIYAKNDIEWWYREPLGRSVSLFTSTSVNSKR